MDYSKKTLISELYGKYEGKPILVIGGGPSALTDMARVQWGYPKCVISANEHGYKQTRFKVDYSVSVDFTYNTGHILMRQHLAQFNAVNINRWTWADYRLPDWNYGGDSGLTAILVADMLGGWPVLAVGFDRFVGDRKYFWQPPPKDARSAYRGPRLHHDNQRVEMEKVKSKLQNSCVRPLSGPLTKVWPAWDGNVAGLPPYVPVETRRPPAVAVKVRTIKQAYLHPTDPIPSGVTISVSELEAKRLETTKCAVRV
jgi:hypothetical protein